MKSRIIKSVTAVALAAFLPNSVFAYCGVAPNGWLWANKNFSYLNFTTGPSYVAVPPYPQPVPFSTVIADAGNHYNSFSNLVFTASTPNLIQWVSVDNGNNGTFGTAYPWQDSSATYCATGGCNTTTVRPDRAVIVLNTNVNSLGIQSSLYSNKRRKVTVLHEMGHVIGMGHQNVCNNLMHRYWSTSRPDFLDATQQIWIDANYP